MCTMIINYGNRDPLLFVPRSSIYTCACYRCTCLVTGDLGHQGHGPKVVDSTTLSASDAEKRWLLGIRSVYQLHIRFRGSTRQTSSANWAAPLAISCHILQTFPCLLRTATDRGLGQRTVQWNSSPRKLASRSRPFREIDRGIRFNRHCTAGESLPFINQPMRVVSNHNAISFNFKCCKRT